MFAAHQIRHQIESSLARKIPSALTPQARVMRPVVASGIGDLDELLQGGFPVGALSEATGPECSGRTTMAMSLIARFTEANKVCAWIDVSDSFDPASAASVGVDLKNLLWVRCGTQRSAEDRSSRRFALPDNYLVARPARRGLHGGGYGSHPRTEVQGMASAVGDLLGPRCAEPQHRPRPQSNLGEQSLEDSTRSVRSSRRVKHYDAIEQGIRSADLILQAGGFSAIVLDLGSIPSEYVSRIELSTWHRFRAAAERAQAVVLLLTQYPCAKSSSELQLRFSCAGEAMADRTIFGGIEPQVEVLRSRFVEEEGNIIPLRKRPTSARWQNRTTWAVER